MIANALAFLPPDPDEVGNGRLYQVGDFAGARPEVEQNLSIYGDPAGLELAEGWFSDTLKGRNSPLALLWRDVDLTSSITGVLVPCLPHLDPRGAIFCHEFEPGYIKHSKITVEHGPSGVIGRIMLADDPDYSAAFARGCLASVGLPSASNPISWSTS